MNIIYTIVDAIKKHKIISAFIAIGVLVASLAFFLWYMITPSNELRRTFADQSGESLKSIDVVISPGQSIRTISLNMKEKGLVRSAVILQSLVVLTNNENSVKSGFYAFTKPENTVEVFKRIVKGDFRYVPVKITIPEGSDSRKIAEIVSNAFGKYPQDEILDLFMKEEGYLFPDTYYFSPIDTPEVVMKKMSDTFKLRIKKYEEEIASSGKTLSDIVTMASIIEREVQTDQDMAMVADILQRRIDIGMPLQVDATFMYFLGKGSFDLSIQELRTDHPYNTYTRKGLPPGPIGNPGARSIEAVLRPIKNDYLFYLSDKQGITRFAKTHDGHVRNKNIYLR
jgi:UPF0755 protein